MKNYNNLTAERSWNNNPRADMDSSYKSKCQLEEKKIALIIKSKFIAEN